MYAKLQTAFPSAIFVWATTTPIKGDASITTMNDRALMALPGDVKVHDLHASILTYCEKEGSETCSLHEPAGPLTPVGTALRRRRSFIVHRQTHSGRRDGGPPPQHAGGRRDADADPGRRL